MPRGRNHVDVEVLGRTTVHSNRRRRRTGRQSKLRARSSPPRRAGSPIQHELFGHSQLSHPPRRNLPASGQPANGRGADHRRSNGALMPHSLVTRPPRHAIGRRRSARRGLNCTSSERVLQRAPSHRATPGTGVALNRAHGRAVARQPTGQWDRCRSRTRRPPGRLISRRAGALTFLYVCHQYRKGCTVGLHRQNGRQAERAGSTTTQHPSPGTNLEPPLLIKAAHLCQQASQFHTNLVASGILLGVGYTRENNSNLTWPNINMDL